MIYLRSENDSNGDVVDLHWYCSETCYAASFDETGRRERGGLWETGGAYPGGAESDSPDFCATCERPVGNPLTDDGIATVREWQRDLPFRLDPTGTLAARMAELRQVYGDRPRYAEIG